MGYKTIEKNKAVDTKKSAHRIHGSLHSYPGEKQDRSQFPEWFYWSVFKKKHKPVLNQPSKQNTQDNA